MEWTRVDSSHFDSREGVFGIETWNYRGGPVGKVKVYLWDSDVDRDDGAYRSEEFWLHLGNPIATRNLSYYPGYSYEEEVIYENGRLISSLSRSAESELDQIPVTSSATFVESDPEMLSDQEWIVQMFDDSKSRAEKLLDTARTVQSLGGGTQPLLTRSYRIYLDDFSPDGKYALAWSIKGEAHPAWDRWETESWEYIYSLGEYPSMPISVISLETGAVIGQLNHDNGEDGWTEWARDESLFVYFRETSHVGPLESKVYRVSGDEVTMIIPDLPAAVGEIALKELEKAGHPYCAKRAMVAPGDAGDQGVVDTWISSVSEEGVFSFETTFEDQMEEALGHASLRLDLKIDATTGQLQLVSSEVADFQRVPLSWDEAGQVISTSASSWITSPPAVEEYYRFETYPETGILGLYNDFGGVLSPDVIEIVMKRSIYQRDIDGLNLYSPDDFARYNPEAIAEINRELSHLLNPAAVLATRGLYEAKFKALAQDFNAALRYWEENPAELKRQGEVYLKHIKDGTLPDGYYLLDGDIANFLMEEHASEWETQLHYLTAIRFWMRRSIDGSKDEFASILQKTIRAFDSEYFAKSGFPDLIIESP